MKTTGTWWVVLAVMFGLAPTWVVGCGGLIGLEDVPPATDLVDAGADPDRGEQALDADVRDSSFLQSDVLDGALPEAVDASDVMGQDVPVEGPSNPCIGFVGEVPGYCDGSRTCGNGQCLLKDGYNCRAAGECASLRCDLGYFPDADHDSYGDKLALASVGFCGAAPANWVKNSSDCCDQDADVHPGQTMYFMRTAGCGGFDYDCNGLDEPEFPVRADTTNCVSGWRDTVPACGQSSVWWLLMADPLCRFLEDVEFQFCR